MFILPADFNHFVQPSPEYRTMKIFAQVQKQIALALSPSDGSLILPERTPISNQGAAGSCAPTATCDAFEQIMEEPVDLSRRFVYWNSMRWRHMETVDKGTDLFACHHSLTAEGVCEETYWPYDPDGVLIRPPLLAYERAYDNRLASFYAIRMEGGLGLSSIDDALLRGLPTTFTVAIRADDLNNYKGGDQVLVSPPAVDAAHAMVIVGWRTISGTKVYVVRNSWGREWGNDGYGLIAPEYLQNPLYRQEFYVPTNLKLAK